MMKHSDRVPVYNADYFTLILLSKNVCGEIKDGQNDEEGQFRSRYHAGSQAKFRLL